ncbi:hypothetical protein [Corynebacterium glyciniphilum]|uniref:hypothetical protein n=1 Tax=Corynebacterium glyciniphilum TaxID=1404244 RepID=UPI0023529098
MRTHATKALILVVETIVTVGFIVTLSLRSAQSTYTDPVKYWAMMGIYWGVVSLVVTSGFFLAPQGPVWVDTVIAVAALGATVWVPLAGPGPNIGGGLVWIVAPGVLIAAVASLAYRVISPREE